MSLEGLFLLLLAFIILSLTYCCCGKEFNRRTKEKYTKREKIFALSAAFTLLMVQIIAVVVGVLSTKNIIDGVNISASSIASIATDYQTLNSGLPLLINTTVNQIDGVVSATFAATAVDSSWSNSLDITELTNGINQLERISSSISAVSTLLDLEIADYQNSAIFVGFTASTLMSQIYTFNGVHATTSGTFKLNPSFQYAITDLSTIVPLDSSSLTPISSTISTYFGVTQVLSLVALRASLNSSYTTRVNTGKNILAASLTNVQRSIQSNIVKKKNSILNSTVFISNLASETLYTQVQIPPITGTLLMVGAYLLWILLGVIIIDLIIIIAGIVKRRDRISRTCTICTPVSRVIIHVLLLVFFTTSIILGDVCTFVFTENLQSMGAGTSSSFAALRGMSDNCISGTGFQDTSLDIPQVIGSLVFSDSTWTNSLKSIAISNQVAPLTPLISSIDPLYPASVTKLLVSMGSLSCLNYQIPSTAFNTYTNLLITNTTVGFSGPNTTWFTFNSTLSGVNDPALQAAIALMSGEISNIKSSAQSLTIRNSSSNLTSLLTSRDRINGYILNLTAQIASYKTLSTSLITLYNTLNSTEAWTAGLKSRVFSI